MFLCYTCFDLRWKLCAWAKRRLQSIPESGKFLWLHDAEIAALQIKRLGNKATEGHRLIVAICVQNFVHVNTIDSIVIKFKLAYRIVSNEQHIWTSYNYGSSLSWQTPWLWWKFYCAKENRFWEKFVCGTQVSENCSPREICRTPQLRQSPAIKHSLFFCDCVIMSQRYIPMIFSFLDQTDENIVRINICQRWKYPRWWLLLLWQRIWPMTMHLRVDLLGLTWIGAIPPRQHASRGLNPDLNYSLHLIYVQDYDFLEIIFGLKKF